MSYKSDQEILVALISHLAATRFKCLAPQTLSRRLGMSHEDILRVLNAYPGIFWKKEDLSRGHSEHLYTLQLRYALRSQDKEEENGEVEEKSREPLSGDLVGALINFVQFQAQQESEAVHARSNMRAGLVNAIIAASSALVGAVLGVVLSATLKS